MAPPNGYSAEIVDVRVCPRRGGDPGCNQVELVVDEFYCMTCRARHDPIALGKAWDGQHWRSPNG